MILNYYNDLVYKPSELFLNKDFGQVSTVLGRIYHRKVVHLICCNSKTDELSAFEGNQLFQAVKRLRFLPSKLDFIKNLSAYIFLLRFRRKFETLVLFPFCPLSDLMIALLFSVLNPGAKIILKLDANTDHLEKLQENYLKNPKGLFRQHSFYRRLLELSDLVIYETWGAGRILEESTFLGLVMPEKYINVFNGISEHAISKRMARSTCGQRDDVIIVSGRLSSPQKNIELIFRADPVPPGWKIKFLGHIDDSFREKIELYKAQTKDFDRKYEFIGELHDKTKYYLELSRAKILLLCSEWEGFPMVYSEAHYFGLYIVTTDVSGSAEATDRGRVGLVIPKNSPAALRAALRSACLDINLEQSIAFGRDWGQRNFIWERSLKAERIRHIFKAD